MIFGSKKITWLRTLNLYTCALLSLFKWQTSFEKMHRLLKVSYYIRYIMILCMTNVVSSWKRLYSIFYINSHTCCSKHFYHVCLSRCCIYLRYPCESNCQANLINSKTYNIHFDIFTYKHYILSKFLRVEQEAHSPHHLYEKQLLAI